MPNRRQFLSLAGTFALSNMLLGCQNSADAALQINMLKGSLSPQLLALFHREQDKSTVVKLRPTEQLAELFTNLEKLQSQGEKTSRRDILQRPLPVADLVTLGHGWYQQAIAEQLIQPLPLEQLTGWKKLGEPWQSFLQRDTAGKLDPAGKIWGQPYRWGTTMLVYNKDKFKKLGWTPKDWADLWREDIRGKVSLLNHSREVLGLLLKKQGKSYNEMDRVAIADLEKDFQALHQNVKFYSSTHYLQPLTMDETWIAQGWSQDILPMLKNYPHLGAVVPASGTAIWCDLWVQPRKSEKSFAELQPWLDFCWQPETITQISRSTNGASPLIYATANLDSKIIQNPLIFITPDIFKKSEIIEALPPEILAQYQTLWKKVRQA